MEHAHAAFQSTANRRLRSLLALGVDGGAASAALLDDLIAPHAAGGWGSSSGASGGGSGGSGASSATAAATSGGATATAAAAGSSLSVQHVVDCTGASVACASKILLLKEEIGRLRREGHSTANLIGLLRERLRDAGEHRKDWRDESENAEGGRRAGASSTSSKKRRVGDDGAHAANSLAGGGRPAGGWKEKAGLEKGGLLYDDGRLQDLTEFSSPNELLPLPQGRCLGEATDLLGMTHEGGDVVSPEGKRQRDEAGAAELALLKKLKLRQTET